MTPNKRGRGRRRGRRMSAAQKKALVARLNRGKRAAAKRRGRKGGRKSSRRSSRRGKGRRRSSKRRSTRRGKGRRRSSKRRSTRGRRRGRKAGRRRGKARRRGRKAGRRRGKARRRGFRKNFSISGDYNFVEILVGGLLGGAGMFFLQKYLAPHVLSAVPSVAAYTPAISGTVGGLATALIANKFLESSPAKDFVNAAALGMFLGGFGLAAPALMSNFGISGIPYVNTSGWGSRRPVGAYELRGTGAYELRGMGAYPQQALAGGQYAQALASYELRGMGAYPQQALAGGQYAQALAAYELRGLGQQPVDDGILPMHADAALDWADQDTEGEYVNSQLQPAAPLFFQDKLVNLGVPPNMGGGIPSMSIWNPTGDTDVDQSATVGGIFDDPNVLPERAEPLDMMSGGRFKPHT